MSKPPKPPPPDSLVPVNTRLFSDDVVEIKRRAAEKRIPWQVELRLTLHTAIAARDLKVIR